MVWPGGRPFIASTTLVTRASSSLWVQDAIAGSWDVGFVVTGWGSGWGYRMFGTTVGVGMDHPVGVWGYL
ncbi:hypothetical protein HanHA300_Chr16g0594331 [Helianthus annuus]|nr:hypothetical protein HanHA300_Chr16g0594331 [Helianthus annuus]KAJ0440993.1 hypothetical protein HanIR_Chr16g0792761 [Helianthus annuus]KAJ0459059.1 hypothetical protein HanHA89_Chr16g0644641 [Helianthus annuus]KAJ0639612.1 hypothetical protein HanLR1_Chr16g0605751 [Helianthus annuus]KAJ0643572.1 hypothetical protein HanOQP8_Chr16g0602031 [Helianthus annuus]